MTLEEYTDLLDKHHITREKLPTELWRSFEFVDNIISNEDARAIYEQSDKSQRAVNIYFEKFEKALPDLIKIHGEKEPVASKKSSRKKSAEKEPSFDEEKFYHEVFIPLAESPKSADVRKAKKLYEELTPVQREKFHEYFRIGTTDFQETTRKEADEAIAYLISDKNIIKTRPKKKPQPKTTRQTKTSIVPDSWSKKVELIDAELKFIRRYVNMHDKVKSDNQIRLFLNALQKAIIERRIRKTSEYADEIMEIQAHLIKLSGKSSRIQIDEKTRAHYLGLLGRQAEMPTVKFIKSYVTLQGKLIPRQKAVNLQNRIVRAFNSGKYTEKDKYFNQVETVRKSLEKFIRTKKSEGILSLTEHQLNGLNGILEDTLCCNDLNGVSDNLQNVVMRSTDFIKLKFDKLGFRGKWLDFIGDPSRGFKTMIFGLPKMGKSYLMVEFAGYLVRNHGTVLYVAKEEALDNTLQKKLTEKTVAHPDLYVSDYLPDDLSQYDFVFLDSVTKLRLSPEQLEELSKKYPNTSFVYVFQTTKKGEFRGSNEFQHDMDVVIEVPEKGKAIQFGRFNQGGEIDIFSNPYRAAA